jgi:acyl-CoA-binding protein
MLTLWPILSTYTHYDGSPTAHDDVLKVLKAHGCNKYDSSTAWCVLQIMAAFAENNAMGMIGGINQRSKYLKAAAQKLGIWHDGGSGILPCDIVVYADKNGVPNHSEFAIGAKLNISGNYNGGTSRRIRAGGRRIAGYVRPKYAAMPAMNDLQITIAAVDVLLDIYGSGATRTKQLTVFGKENASRIQQEVDRIAGDENEKIFSMAVYAIAGHAGKDDYRKKRLGSFYEKTRKKINAIYDLRGKTIDQAAADVIAGRYRKNETRKLLLKFAGYDPQKVQDKVNEIQKAKQSAAKETKKVPAGQKIHSASLISIFADGDRSKKSIDGLQGDSFVIKADQIDGKKKAIVLDTARYCAKWKIYKELEGVEDAIMVITHPHSDHMGQTANNLVEDGKVSHVYLPARATIHADYLARYDALTKACSKAKVPVTQLRQGDTIQYGGVTAKVIFQQISTSKDTVNMRSL